MNNKLALGFLLACTLVTSGCMTPYQPRGATGGYVDQKVDERTYKVSFFGNGNTPRDRVFRFWLYRCAELTVQNGYDSFVILGRTRQAAVNLPHIPSAGSDLNPDTFNNARVTGYVPTYVYVPGTRTITSYSAYGYIRMLTGEFDPGNEPFFPARKVLADLGSEIKQGMATAQPRGGAYDPDIALGKAAAINSQPADEAKATTLDDLKELLPESATNK